MRKLNIILANAPIKNGNRGCVALSITSIFLLDEILNKYNIDYNIYLCDSGFTLHKEYIYKIPNKELKYITCGYPLDYSLKDNLKSFIKKELFKNVNIFMK